MGKKSKGKNKKTRKGKMPPGLAKWHAQQRAKSAPKGDSNMAAKKTKRRSSSVRKYARQAKRYGRRAGRSLLSGGRTYVGRVKSLVSKDTALKIAGGAIGMVAANQLAPRIANMVDGKMGTSTKAGQVVIKVGIGVLGGAAISTQSPALGEGFAIGAIAEPIAGSVRSMIAQQEASKKGVSALAGLGALHQIDEDVEVNQ